nr:zinc finger protein 761-like [Aedes albopictus]
MNTTDICRVCMEDDCDAFSSLFNVTPDVPPQVSPAVMIVDCTGIPVEKSDGLPEVVCSECLPVLRESYKLREKCRKTDRKLRKILNLTNRKQTAATVPNSKSDGKADCISITNKSEVQVEEPLFTQPDKSEDIERPTLHIKSEVVFDSVQEELEEDPHLDEPDNKLLCPSIDDNQGKLENITEHIHKKSETIQVPVNRLKQEDAHDPPHFEPEYLVEEIRESVDTTAAGSVRSDQSPPPVDHRDDILPEETSPLMNAEPNDALDEELVYEEMDVEALEEIEYENFEAIDEDFQLPEESEHHEAAICCGCPLEFRTKTQLEQHSKLVHLPEKDKDTTLQEWYMCGVCYKRHSSAKALQFHQRSSRVSRRMRTCASCRLVLNSVRKKKHHEQLHRLLPEDFAVNCCGCDQVVPFSQLGTHAERTHQSAAREMSESTKLSKFVCEICFLDCGFKQRLDIHQAKQEIPEAILKKLSQPEDEFTAPVADFGGIQRFVCDICEKNFSTKGNLKAHRILHLSSDKPFKCDQCDKTFSKKCNYNVHMLRMHSTESQFPCAECEKSFKCASNLKTHMRVHTKERPYQCDYCPKAFGYLSDKRRHEVGHSGNYPFKCDQCGKPYSRKTLLSKHLGTCGKQVSKKSQGNKFKTDLKHPVHVGATEELDSSVPMHACDLCDDWFVSMEELADHHANLHIQTLDEGSYDAEVEIE